MIPESPDLLVVHPRVLPSAISIAFLVSKNYNRQVKHLIRNTKSLQYFNHGHWTTDAREAQAFRTSEAALETSAQCGLNDTEVVIRSLIDPSQTLEVSSPPRSAGILPAVFKTN